MTLPKPHPSALPPKRTQFQSQPPPTHPPSVSLSPGHEAGWAAIRGDMSARAPSSKALHEREEPQLAGSQVIHHIAELKTPKASVTQEEAVRIGGSTEGEPRCEKTVTPKSVLVTFP